MANKSPQEPVAGMTSFNPMPQVTQWLLSKAADRLESELQERMLEEWAADLDEANSWYAKLLAATSIYLVRNAFSVESKELNEKVANRVRAYHTAKYGDVHIPTKSELEALEKAATEWHPLDLNKPPWVKTQTRKRDE